MTPNTSGHPPLSLVMRNKVRSERLRHGLSIRQLAEQAAISKQVLIDLERDDGHAPSSTVMLKLTSILSSHARRQGFTACGCDWTSLWWVEPTRTRPTKQRVA
jgi:DNA-binding XRE family transcriptional regulator